MNTLLLVGALVIQSAGLSGPPNCMDLDALSLDELANVMVAQLKAFRLAEFFGLLAYAQPPEKSEGKTSTSESQTGLSFVERIALHVVSMWVVLGHSELKPNSANSVFNQTSSGAAEVRAWYSASTLDKTTDTWSLVP